jgi:hypothetical protein
MRKNIVTLLFSAFLLIGTTGCSVTTSGEGSWEIYGGFRTKQHSPKPANVTIKSQIVDSLTDGEISDKE